MHKVKVISFPRSGTQLLLWTLLKYFSENINYPDYDGQNQQYKSFLGQTQTLNQALETMAPMGKVWFAGKVIYRDIAFNERWEHVEASMLHSHGENIPFQNDPTSRYILQYRNPIEASISLIRTWPEAAKTNSEHVALELQIQVKKWEDWMVKWVDNNKEDNTYRLEYSDFIRNFEYHIRSILLFLHAEIKEDFLIELIKLMAVKRYHVLQEDQLFLDYYPILEKLQKGIESKLQQYSIPLVNFHE